MKNFIRWSGNKNRLKKYIIPMFPQTFNRYFEPFIGSGSVFLSLQPDKWVINDINSDLINVWKAVKDKPKQLINHLKSFSNSFLHQSLDGKRERCKQVANDLNKLKPGLKRTAYFMILKFCSYMGIIIRHEKFIFAGIDLEYIHKRPEKIPSLFQEHNFNNIMEVSKYLSKTNGQILNQDYKDILEFTKKNDFVFLDPPYIEEHDYSFIYNKDEKIDVSFMTDLKKELRKLDKKGVKWLMTQSDTTHVRQIFKNYSISEVKIYRPSRQLYSTELIIKNY